MTGITSPARAIADVTEGTILASVDIAVPPARVFAALTDGNEIVRWWGNPQLYTTTSWQSDFRVGGRWHAEGMGADSKPFSVEGEFLEIDAPHRLVQTWEPQWDGGARTTLIYQLTAIEGGTRLVVRHEGFRGRPDSCQGHADGWVRVLDWLAGFVSPKPTPQPDTSLYFFARLLSPRPSFMQDMSEEERQMMREHGAYWAARQAEGKMLLFGPVADPKGGWGMAVLRVSSEAELHELQSHDPAVLGHSGLYYENLPMPRVIFREA